MIRQRTASAILLLAATFTSASAQPVRVRLHTPPPNQVSIENLWWVDLNNTTQNTYTARLHGEVSEARQGLVYRANTDSFRIPPGMKRVTLRNVNIRDQWAKPGYEAFIVRTGLLPEGDYHYVVRLEPDLGGDSGNVTVRHPTPPRLLSPRSDERVPVRQPVFSWTPPGNYSGAVDYRLTIVEVFAGQTREEALRSNRPLFQQSGIRSTQFRFPLSTRQLDLDRPYAWRVEAVLPGRAGNPLASDMRAFHLSQVGQRPMEKASLVLTREVVRQGNYYSVALSLYNNTSSDMTDVVVVDSSYGFQVMDQASAYLKFENGAQPYIIPGTFETGTDNYGTTSWITVTNPTMTIPSKRTLLIGYGMLPLQYVNLYGPGHIAGVGCRVTYKVGEEQRARSFNSKSVEVTGCDEAWKTADYLIVTNPMKLYEQYASTRADVDKLLATMARLAGLKKGVMLHFPATSATVLRSAIKLTGTKLANGWKDNGYLLLVGESEIVPVWDTVKRVPTRPLPWCDHQYADIDDDDYPELRVGRIIGTSAAALTAPLRSSIEVRLGKDGVHYDGSRALLLTGIEQPSKGDNFTVAAGPGAQYLNTKSGVTAHYWGQEYITRRIDVLAKALTHTPVENGGAATDTLSYLLGHYTETQLAAWLFVANNPSSFASQYPLKTGDTYFFDYANRKRRVPVGFGENGIAQALLQAEGIENARRGGWTNQLYRYPASPADSCGLILQATLPKQDAVFFSAHGNYNNFNRLTTTVANASDYTSDKRRPVMVSFACFNGDYRQASSLARALLNRGVGAFIAYSAMTSTAWFGSQVRDHGFTQYWSKGRRIGDVFWDWKKMLAQSATTDSGKLRMLYGHNLYGDPKFGGN